MKWGEDEGIERADLLTAFAFAFPARSARRSATQPISFAYRLLDGSSLGPRQATMLSVRPKLGQT